MPALNPSQNPFELFNAWFAEAKQTETSNPNAMTLSTLSPNKQPSSRIVLLKQHDHNGFTFYTNLSSQKSQELLTNPNAALLFYWQSLNRQVRIEGIAKLIPDEQSNAYFATRPLGAQWGAWASRQSQPLPSRAQLEQEVKAISQRFATGLVPRPPFWSGFCVSPYRFEFWQEQNNRLHDRLAFIRQEKGNFLGQRLYP